ncbi:site-specific integrase [Polaromonas naphthalenivorans]|nr:site-specific integrase [Polaromonas naphthalenivorans]
MKSTPFFAPTKYVMKIGLHHFAHLRAIAEGVDAREAGKLYLGVEHGHEAITASRQTIEAVRSIARRHGEKSAWRLIGLTVKPKTVAFLKSVEDGFVNIDKARMPSLEQYIEEHDLDDWGAAEVLEMYRDAYPASEKGVASSTRRNRLRQRQLALLSKLEALSAEVPTESDPVAGWFDDVTASKLVTAGLINLGMLRQAIDSAGRWYRFMPGVGKLKAERIAQFLGSIMPATAASTRPAFALAMMPSQYTPYREIQTIESPACGSTPILSGSSVLKADNDMDAVNAWIAARSGSKLTATVYLREAVRLMLWLQQERHAIGFKDMTVEDCLAYMAFLQNIPPSWISRRKAKPFEAGWAPFRGQLSHDSHRQSVIVVSALFLWLHSASYINQNPWVLVNRKTGDDKNRIVKESKSISEFGYSEIIRYIDAQPPTAASERIRFIFKFLEAVGLRSMEFLHARLKDFDKQPEGWVLYVHGKGAKNRYVFIPNQAFEALQRYLQFRGLGGIETADPKAPLISSTLDSMEPVGYRPFYQHVKSWTLRAIQYSTLPAKERTQLERASPHWLRHTFGARSVARDVAMDAIQAQMGHASIETTMSIYGRAPLKRRAEELSKAFT